MLLSQDQVALRHSLLSHLTNPVFMLLPAGVYGTLVFLSTDVYGNDRDIEDAWCMFPEVVTLPIIFLLI